MQDKLEALRKIQQQVAKKVVLEDRFGAPLELVAGIDLAFLGNEAIVACVVMDFPPQRVVETHFLTTVIDFPYVATFLAFREGPAIVRAIHSPRTSPDIFLINAHGIAHPLRCGCASHVGVQSGKPTIGVTVSRLYGECSVVPHEEGEATALNIGKEQVGWVLRSRIGCKPIFVSPGHLVGLDSSLRIVKASLCGNKLPEPMHLAHVLARGVIKRPKAGETEP